MTSIPTMPNVKPTQQTLDANTEETRFREELDAAERLMIVNENIGLRRNIEAHAGYLGIKILYRPAPGGELANLSARFIVIREIDSQMSQAEAHKASAGAHHDLEHEVREPCPNTTPHFQRFHRELKTTCCLRCELDAWLGGMRRSPVWSRHMHTTLVASLRSYRAYVPAPIEVIHEADALMQDGFEREQARRARWNRQLEQQRRVELALVPLDVRNRDLDEEIGRQRVTFKALKRSRLEIEAAGRQPCPCGRRASVVERLTTGSVRPLCAVCRDAAVAQWRASRARTGARTGTGTAT